MALKHAWECEKGDICQDTFEGTRYEVAVERSDTVGGVTVILWRNEEGKAAIYQYRTDCSGQVKSELILDYSESEDVIKAQVIYDAACRKQGCFPYPTVKVYQENRGDGYLS